LTAEGYIFDELKETQISIICCFAAKERPFSKVVLFILTNKY